MGNTELVVSKALAVCGEEGLEPELLDLADLPAAQCTECMVRKEEKTRPIDDDFPEMYGKMLASAKLILGSSVFFGLATPEMKALIDHAG